MSVSPTTLGPSPTTTPVQSDQSASSNPITTVAKQAIPDQSTTSEQTSSIKQHKVSMDLSKPLKGLASAIMNLFKKIKCLPDVIYKAFEKSDKRLDPAEIQKRISTKETRTPIKKFLTKMTEISLPKGITTNYYKDPKNERKRESLTKKIASLSKENEQSIKQRTSLEEELKKLTSPEDIKKRNSMEIQINSLSQKIEQTKEKLTALESQLEGIPKQKFFVMEGAIADLSSEYGTVNFDHFMNRFKALVELDAGYRESLHPWEKTFDLETMLIGFLDRTLCDDTLREHFLKKNFEHIASSHPDGGKLIQILRAYKTALSPESVSGNSYTAF